jgi:2-methylcitrate dehydratase PrpD
MAHQLRGFRPTATAGPPAAAAAVAIGWDLPREVTDRAIAIACNFSGGLRRHSGGSLSPTRIQSGEAARAGVRAVLLAQAGLGAPANAFDGDGGFFDAFGAGPLDPGVAEYLGTPPVFAIESVDIKFHCTPYQFVTSLDCLLDIVDAFAPDPSTIERVVVSMPGEHASISKKASWSPPTSLDAAALDLQFCCAVVLITGSILWPSVLGAHLDDHETIELARKVAIVEGAVEDATFSTVAGSWPASASVTVIGAKTFDASLDRPRVTANDPSIRELVDAKCRHLLGPVTAEALRDLEGFLGSGDSFTAAARAIEREATFLPANRTVEGK